MTLDNDKFTFIISFILKKDLEPFSSLGLPNFQVEDFWLCGTSSCLMNPELNVRILNMIFTKQTFHKFSISSFCSFGFFFTELNHFQNSVWSSSLIKVGKIKPSYTRRTQCPKKAYWVQVSPKKGHFLYNGLLKTRHVFLGQTIRNHKINISNIYGFALISF